MTERTCWLRYRVGTAASAGSWRYLNWDFEDDREAANEIIYQEEQWILTADRASVYVELNVVPPKEVIEKELVSVEGNLKFLQHRIEKLKELLNVQE